MEGRKNIGAKKPLLLPKNSLAVCPLLYSLLPLPQLRPHSNRTLTLSLSTPLEIILCTRPLPPRTLRLLSPFCSVVRLLVSPQRLFKLFRRRISFELGMNKLVSHCMSVF